MFLELIFGLNTTKSERGGWPLPDGDGGYQARDLIHEGEVHNLQLLIFSQMLITNFILKTVKCLRSKMFPIQVTKLYSSLSVEVQYRKTLFVLA